MIINNEIIRISTNKIKKIIFILPNNILALIFH